MKFHFAKVGVLVSLFLIVVALVVSCKAPSETDTAAPKAVSRLAPGISSSLSLYWPQCKKTGLASNTQFALWLVMPTGVHEFVDKELFDFVSLSSTSSRTGTVRHRAELEPTPVGALVKVSPEIDDPTASYRLAIRSSVVNGLSEKVQTKSLNGNPILESRFEAVSFSKVSMPTISRIDAAFEPLPDGGKTIDHVVVQFSEPLNWDDLEKHVPALSFDGRALRTCVFPYEACGAGRGRYQYGGDLKYNQRNRESFQFTVLDDVSSFEKIQIAVDASIRGVENTLAFGVVADRYAVQVGDKIVFEFASSDFVEFGGRGIMWCNQD